MNTDTTPPADQFDWHTGPGGLCPTCGAVARKGTTHRALRADELPRWRGPQYVKRVRVCWGTDVDIRPLG